MSDSLAAKFYSGSVRGMKTKQNQWIYVTIGFVLLLIAIFVSKHLFDQTPRAHYERYEQDNRLDRIRDGLIEGK